MFASDYGGLVCKAVRRHNPPSKIPLFKAIVRLNLASPLSLNLQVPDLVQGR